MSSSILFEDSVRLLESIISGDRGKYVAGYLCYHVQMRAYNCSLISTLLISPQSRVVLTRDVYVLSPSSD